MTTKIGIIICDHYRSCAGGNVEYIGEEMVKNGAEIIHLATGLVVGYPPCPYIDTFVEFLEAQHGVKVVLGTHTIPQKYLDMHTRLGNWNYPSWGVWIEPTIANETSRINNY